MSEELFLHRIQWVNPYTDPPDGRPRVLAEVASHERHLPDELRAQLLAFKKGRGYSVTFGRMAAPINARPPEKLAESRQKRVHKKMAQRYPLFAESFAEEKIAADPEYYLEGNSRADRERLEHLDWERRRYAFYLANAGRLLVYDHPPTDADRRENNRWEQWDSR